MVYIQPDIRGHNRHPTNKSKPEVGGESRPGDHGREGNDKALSPWSVWIRLVKSRPSAERNLSRAISQLGCAWLEETEMPAELIVILTRVSIQVILVIDCISMETGSGTTTGLLQWFSLVILAEVARSIENLRGCEVCVCERPLVCECVCVCALCKFISARAGCLIHK